MIRKYIKKNSYKRVTINLGFIGDPVREIFERKVKKGCNSSEMLREAIMTMWGGYEEFETIKTELLGAEVIRFRTEIAVAFDQKRNRLKELIKMGLTIVEIEDIAGESVDNCLIREAMKEMGKDLSSKELKILEKIPNKVKKEKTTRKKKTKLKKKKQSK